MLLHISIDMKAAFSHPKVYHNYIIQVRLLLPFEVSLTLLFLGEFTKLIGAFTFLMIVAGGIFFL